MSIPPEELAEVGEVLEAVRPYLGDMVLIGGWAHRLFRLHPLSRRPAFEPLTTEDVDFAVPQEVKQRDAGPISKLLERADFEPVHRSIHRPHRSSATRGRAGCWSSSWRTWKAQPTTNLEGARTSWRSLA